MSTIESLLAGHRETLTTLYTTLSPTPLPLLNAKLDALHLALASTIEQQRVDAEQEVDQVERRLVEGWKKVEDWRLALGESDMGGKKRGEGPLLLLIDEVESVLQGMRSRMQERGELIVNLQKRLSGFLPVLEADFLSLKLEDIEAGWEGLDLRLERMSSLEREVMRCEAEIAHRRDVLNANVNEIFAIRAELGIHQHDSSSSSTSKRSSDAAHTPVSDPFDEAILCHLGVGEAREKKELLPTSENLLRVEAKRKWLEDEKDHRNTTIQTTYDKLYPLWTMLGVSEAETEQFVNTWMGSTSDVVNAYQSELSRMLTLKRSNLSAFIEREREALSSLWDVLYLSPPQRLASFPPFAISVAPSHVWNAVKGAEEEVVNDNVSEELLVAHERERERVELEVERTKPVLERLSKYFSVVEEMRELEASAADPSRLLGKATRGDPGRLLREEKARKRVVKEKPKLEAELRQFIPAWEQENNRPFLVNGVRFLDDLEHKMEAEAMEKENKKRAKLGSSTSSSSNRTVPLRPQATGTTTAPLKRQMTGKGGPVPKRQTPMTTGGSRAPSVLGNHNGVSSSNMGPPSVPNKLLAQSTGRSVASSAPGFVPSGWGGSVVDTSTAPAHGGHAMIQPQATGGFRPRSSTMSAGGSSVGGWSARTG